MLRFTQHDKREREFLYTLLATTDNVGKADSGVSLEPIETDAFYRRFGEFRFERFGAQAQNILQVDSCPVTIEFELLIFTGRRVLLIGTRYDTFFAAEEPVADFLGRPRRDLSLVFYCQIIDAHSRVK